MAKDSKWATFTMRMTPEEMKMIDAVRADMQEQSISNVTRTDVVRVSIKQYCEDWESRRTLTSK